MALYGLAAYVVLPWLWRDYEHQPGLAQHTMVTTTAQGIPGDPLNVGVVGSKPQLVYAMRLAGWDPADAITLRSSIDIGLSVVLDRPYDDAPVSSLLFDGRKQDLAFERLVGQSAKQRHHVRLWRVLEMGAEGREVWLGSASFDRGVGLSHDTLQITHHIDPDLDHERGFFISTLADAKLAASTYQVTGIGPTLSGRNGEGDPYYTDGEVTIAVLDSGLDPAAPQPHISKAPVEHTSRGREIKRLIWAMVVSAGRAFGIISEPAKD